MNKKQKLRNAVILGLLMSSVTVGSVWAESLNVNHIIDNNANVTAGNPIYGIWGYKYFAGGTVSYYPYVNKYDSINITVKNNYYSDILDPYCGDEAIGIGDADDSGVNLESKSGISVNVETRNAQNGYGINASHGKEINLIAQNDIYIDLKKTEGIRSTSAVKPVYEDSIVYGIYSANNSDVKLTSKVGSINIEAYYDKEAANSNNKLKEGNIYGVSNVGGTVDLTAGNTISITANSANGTAYGIYTNSDKDTNLNGNVSITAVADETGKAYGIYAENGSKVGITGDTSVSGNNGALVISGNDNDESDYQVTVKGNLTAKSNESAAITLEKNGSLRVTGTKNIIEANVDDRGYGATHSIKADDGSTFIMGDNNSTNELRGVVYTRGQGTSVTLNGSNWVYSSTHGSSEEGREKVVAALYAQNKSNINLNAGENGINYITTSFEFDADDENETESERTIWAQQGGKINIEGQTYIFASNSEEYTNGKKSNARGIAITAGTGQDLNQFRQDNKLVGIEDKDRSTVALNYAGNSLIKGDIVSGYGGLVTVNGGYITENGTQVALNDSAKGSLDMEGNALAANGGKLNLDLGNGGTWYGRADDYGDAGIDSNGNHTKFYNPAFSDEIIEGGTVNVTMHNQSKWVLTGQSWVSTLTANNSIIDMAGAYISDENIDMYDMDHTHALTIGTFKGEGSTFIMDLDAQDRGQSDMLYIKDNQGTFNVQLKEALTDEELNSLGGEGLRFATISGKNPGFANVGVYEKPSVVRYAGTGFSEVTYEVDAKDYVSGEDENYAYNGAEDSFEKGKPGQEFVDEMFKENGGTNLIITGVAGRQTGGIGQTIVDMSKANYTNAIYMDRLNKRMGETRFIDGDEGMWVRMRHDRIGKEDSFRSMNTMYEMGYDVKQEKDNGEHRVGFAIDYMDGSTSYSKLGGDGEISRKGIWMYDTWVGEKGHYRDFVAKWGHLSNDFDVYAVDGQNVTGDYSNNVYSISAEFGKKNDIGNNWYFEPQAQLQYAHVTGAEYMTNAGTAVNVDDINSLIARAGFRLGKDLGERSTVYFKADLMHEFLGEQDVFAIDKSTGTNGAHERYDHGGTWCDIGFGFATAMSKTSYAYLDVETSLGNDYDETYQINAGLQWTF